MSRPKVKMMERLPCNQDKVYYDVMERRIERARPLQWRKTAPPLGEEAAWMDYTIQKCLEDATNVSLSISARQYSAREADKLAMERRRINYSPCAKCVYYCIGECPGDFDDPGPCPEFQEFDGD